ncbi:MAG: aminopeptidase [Acidobacteria bacterium]|nr:aminopeptidase [Acidobacteriota bacterium]
MSDRDDILKAIDTTLADAGRAAVETCLAVRPDDVVTVVTEEAGYSIAAAILAAVEVVGPKTSVFALERLGRRPLQKFPNEILAALDQSTVTVLIVTPLAGELRARLSLLEIVGRRSLRHAHLIAVSADAFRAGMRADYNGVDKLQDRVLTALRAASRIRVTSPAGTDLEATFEPSYRWVKSNGLILPGKWQNLPSGQVYTCPGTIDGVYVADKSIGDWFQGKYPDLEQYPVTLEFSAGRLGDVRSPNATLARELFLFARSNENGDRVGEFGVGTNPWVDFISGQHTLDENVPGVHLALGDPFGGETGAAWSSKTRVSVIGTGMSLYADDRPVIDGGAYATEFVEGLGLPPHAGS